MLEIMVVRNIFLKNGKRTTFTYSKLSAYYSDMHNIKGGHMVQQSPETHLTVTWITMLQLWMLQVHPGFANDIQSSQFF